MLIKYSRKVSFFLLSLTILYSCSDNNSEFNNELSNFLNGSKNNDINVRQKKIFDELYGWDKARKQGMEYCQMLNKGVSKEEIRNNRMVTGLEMITQGKLTPEESADIDIINISIELAAQKAYCPEHREVEQIPIKERLK